MQELLTGIINGSYKALARALSLVENRITGYSELLINLPGKGSGNVIGITGPPGAGKSTLVDALIAEMTAAGKKVGVLCVDPSSPFNLGALLGDRIRMSRWYNHRDVFIRSLANRGSLGGLHPAIIELTDVMKAFGFDYIIVETVGVGQSEVEIAGLADKTVIVLVPEAGDEIQTMKAGLMEIGDIFVVNKADRPGADVFVKNLERIVRSAGEPDGRQVLKTVAFENKGINELFKRLLAFTGTDTRTEKHHWLLTEKAYHLIVAKRMEDVSKERIFRLIEHHMQAPEKFNLYKFVRDF